MRRIGLILVGIMLLAACGGRSSTTHADTIPTATDSPATVAPATNTVTTTNTAVLGTNGTPVRQSVATPIVTSADTPVAGLESEAELKTKLLTLSDMPVGWTTAPSTPDDKSSPLCGHPGASGIDQVRATADYKKSDLGPFVSETLATFHKGDAARWLTEFRAKFTCTTDTISGNDGTPTTFQYAPLSFPKIGDDTYALRMTTDTGLLGSIVIDAVYVRVGDRVINILNTQFGSVDSELTQKLTQIAVERARQ